MGGREGGGAMMNNFGNAKLNKLVWFFSLFENFMCAYNAFLLSPYPTYSPLVLLPFSNYFSLLISCILVFKTAVSA